MMDCEVKRQYWRNEGGLFDVESVTVTGGSRVVVGQRRKLQEGRRVRAGGGRERSVRVYDAFWCIWSREGAMCWWLHATSV